MNELEEAIKYLKESVVIYKNTIPKISKAIETVLNMLKEQEEKNKELMDEYHKRVQERIDLEQELKILQDDIEDKRIVYVDTPEFEDNYISKQKIVDKIDELEQKAISYGHLIDKDEAFKIECEINVLEELLEEA